MSVASCMGGNGASGSFVISAGVYLFLGVEKCSLLFALNHHPRGEPRRTSFWVYHLGLCASTDL
jgi:hypothetical protein